MNAQLQTQAKALTKSSFMAAPSGLLQRKCACGNHTIAGGECAECRKKKHLGLQTKLKVNQPSDSYEQEADQIAEQVMATPAHHVISGAPLRIQPFSEQPTGQMETAPASVDQVLASPGRPLEPALQQDMEQRFGYDFSRVRVHSGATAEQSAQDVNALAYTVGHNIVFGAGRFAPSTNEGRRLIAHELTHVMQQQQTRSKGQQPMMLALSPSTTNAQMLQRKLECNLDPIEKECAGAASTCMNVKEYCTTKYPKPQDIDKLHADAVKGANSYKDKFPNAAENLLHFLAGSGQEKVMKVDVFKNHPATQQKYSDHMTKFKEGAKRRFDAGQLKIGGPAVEMVWTDTANAFSSDYNDLGLAVGGYTLCSKVSARAKDPKEVGGNPGFLQVHFSPWTMQAFDCYNWDPGKGIGLPFATDNDFCCLENAGRSKHFRVRTDPWLLVFQIESIPLAATKMPTKPSTSPPPKQSDDDR